MRCQLRHQAGDRGTPSTTSCPANRFLLPSVMVNQPVQQAFVASATGGYRASARNPPAA